MRALLARLRAALAVLRSRGETADGPDYYAVDVPQGDALMAVADAAPSHAEDWQLWEQECRGGKMLPKRLPRTRGETS